MYQRDLVFQKFFGDVSKWLSLIFFESINSVWIIKIHFKTISFQFFEEFILKDTNSKKIDYPGITPPPSGVYYPHLFTKITLYLTIAIIIWLLMNDWLKIIRIRYDSCSFVLYSCVTEIKLPIVKLLAWYTRKSNQL